MINVQIKETTELYLVVYVLLKHLITRKINALFVIQNVHHVLVTEPIHVLNVLKQTEILLNFVIAFMDTPKM